MMMMMMMMIMIMIMIMIMMMIMMMMMMMMTWLTQASSRCPLGARGECGEGDLFRDLFVVAAPSPACCPGVEIPLEDTAEHPLDTSSKNPLDK